MPDHGESTTLHTQSMFTKCMDAPMNPQYTPHPLVKLYTVHTTQHPYAPQLVRHFSACLQVASLWLTLNNAMPVMVQTTEEEIDMEIH